MHPDTNHSSMHVFIHSILHWPVTCHAQDFVVFTAGNKTLVYRELHPTWRCLVKHCGGGVLHSSLCPHALSSNSQTPPHKAEYTSRVYFGLGHRTYFGQKGVSRRGSDKAETWNVHVQVGVFFLCLHHSQGKSFSQVGAAPSAWDPE